MTTNNDRPPGGAGADGDGDGAGHSRDLLARLHRTNPTVVVFAALGIFLGVLLLPDLPGAVLVVAIAGALGWLLSRTWPVLAPSARVMRLAVIALLLVVAAVKVTQ